MQQQPSPTSPPTVPSRLERITNAVERSVQVLQLVFGATLLFVLDSYFAVEIHAGARYSPAWLTFALPVGATLVWLCVAFINVRQLWREWRVHRQWMRAWRSQLHSQAQPPAPRRTW